MPPRTAGGAFFVSHGRARLSRTGGRIHDRFHFLRAIRRNRLGVCRAPHLAVPLGAKAIFPSETFENRPGQTRRYRRTGWTGSGTDREMDERGFAAKLYPTARNRGLRPARHHASGRVARRLVLLPDWMQSGQASHLRFPRAQPEITHARIEFGERDRAGAHPATREIPDSPGPACYSCRPKERVVLVHPWQVRRFQRCPPRTDHLSSRTLWRRLALGHERS